MVNERLKYGAYEARGEVSKYQRKCTGKKRSNLGEIAKKKIRPKCLEKLAELHKKNTKIPLSQVSQICS